MIISMGQAASLLPADPMSEEAQKAVEEGKKLSEEQVKLDTEWKKDLKEWKTGEAFTKQQIASSIPNSLFLEIRASGSAYKIWRALEDHF